MILNLKSKSPIAKFGEYFAAVRATAFSSNQAGLLATGEGVAGKWIRFWKIHF